MKQLLLLLFFIFFSTVKSEELSSRDSALIVMTQNYSLCQERVVKRDSLISKLKKQNDILNQIKAINDSLELNIKQYITHSDSLYEINKQLTDNAKKIDNTLQESVNLAKINIHKLDSTLVATNEKYNEAVKDCIKPFFLRVEFWGGTVIGFVVGGLAGFIVGELD